MATKQQLMEVIRIQTESAKLGLDLGENEFGIILTPVDMPDGILSAIRRLDSSIELPFVFEGRPYQLRASVRMACFPDDGAEIHGLLETADQRMYTAKRQRHADLH